MNDRMTKRRNKGRCDVQPHTHTNIHTHIHAYGRRSNDVDSLCVDVGKTIVSLNNDKVSRGERIRAFSPSLEREIILHVVLSRTGDL